MIAVYVFVKPCYVFVCVRYAWLYDLPFMN